MYWILTMRLFLCQTLTWTLDPHEYSSIQQMRKLRLPVLPEVTKVLSGSTGIWTWQTASWAFAQLLHSCYLLIKDQNTLLCPEKSWITEAQEMSGVILVRHWNYPCSAQKAAGEEAALESNEGYFSDASKCISKRVICFEQPSARVRNVRVKRGLATASAFLKRKNSALVSRAINCTTR